MLDPLHQFDISPILKMSVNGIDLSFTNSAMAIFVTTALVCTLFALSLKNHGLIPNRIQAFVEMSYALISDMIDTNIGEKGRGYFPFIFSMFFFILFGNLIGMVPGIFTFTSHIIVTFTLAMTVITFITILGIVLHGFRFFSLFAPKGTPKFLLPLLIPIEIISYLSRPVSLSVRLFANMMAGHTMMKIFASFATILGIYGVAPVALNVVLTGLEVVIAILQAYVFTILTCVYLNDAVNLH